MRRHRAIHNDHLRGKFAGQSHGFVPIAGFPDDDNIGLVFQHAAETAAYEAVIVNQQIL